MSQSSRAGHDGEALEDVATVDPTPVPAEISLTFLVRQAWLNLRRATVSALADNGLTMSQFAALFVLSRRPGISAVDLGNTIAMTRQSAQQLLIALERDGLVSRRVNPRDRRLQVTELSELGRATLLRAAAAVSDSEEALERGLPAAQRRAARTWLTNVGDCVLQLTQPDEDM